MTNPAFFQYQGPTDLSLAGPTAIFIPGRSNRNDPSFQEARRRGSEVLAYFNLVEMNKSWVSSMDAEFYMDYKAPLWGGGRTGFQGKTWLLDLRVNSPWVSFAVDYIAKIAQSGLFDGVFLDVIGGKLWDPAMGFDTWPLAEQVEWQNGAVEVVKRLRAAVGSGFILVSNNHWNQKKEGEQYLNGICLEGHDPVSNPAIVSIAGRPYGVPGKRRVLTVNKEQATATKWLTVPGVSHVCWAPTGYAEAGPALADYTDLRIPEMQALIDQLKKTTADLEVAAKAALDAKAAAEAQAAAAVQAKTAIEAKLNQIKAIVNG